MAAQGGIVGLIAAKVSNTGSIVAPEGSVLAGAGNRVTLDLGGPIKIKVEEGVLDALIEQGGAIRADGGLVYLTAKAVGEVTSTVINHTGITEAKTIAAGKDGKIYLLGGMEKDRIVVGGKLDASAPNGGDGGFIETSAAKVKIAADLRVTAAAPKGKTGTWLIDPSDFTISAGDGEQTTSGIGADTLGASLASIDVKIQTDDESEGSGFIAVNSSVTRSSGEGTTTLTLAADQDVVVLDSISGSEGHPLNIVLAARARGGASGMVYVGPGDDGPDPVLRTFGGNITIGGGNILASEYAIGHVLGEETKGSKNFLNYSPVGVTLRYAVLDATSDGSYLSGSSALPSTAEGGGNIVIRGQGGVASEVAGRADGLRFDGDALVMTGGAGSITLDVKGGTGVDSSAGFTMVRGKILANQGLIHIDASAGDGVNRFGMSNVGVTGPLTIATNGSVLLEGGGILMNGIYDESFVLTPGLVLNIGAASNVKAPLLSAMAAPDFNPAYVQKKGAGILTLWGNAQTWSAESSAMTGPTGTFEDISENDTSIRLHGVSSMEALFDFLMVNAQTTADATAVYLRLNTGLSSLYGNTPVFTYSLYNASSEGSAITDANPTGTASWTGGPSANSNASSYSLTYSSGITLGNSSYLLNAGGAVSYTVSPRPVTVTADAKTRVYGNADPALTYSITSGNLVGDDTLTGSLTRSAGNNVGAYVINADGFDGESNMNYAVTTATGMLSISARPITVTADAKAKVYGNVDPALTYSITSGNLVGDDTLTGSLTRSAGNNVGAYVINANGFNGESNMNYAVTTATGRLSISARPITVTADAKAKVYGNVDPALTYSITSGNLVGDDTLTGSLTRGAGNNVGSYLISASGLQAFGINSNYAITGEDSLLTITGLPISATTAVSSVYVVPPVVSRPASPQLNLGLQLVDISPATRSQSSDNTASLSSSLTFDPVAAAKRLPGTVLVLTGGVRRAAEDTDKRSEKKESSPR